MISGKSLSLAMAKLKDVDIYKMSRPLIPYAEYQGCGHFWMIAIYKWDDGIEISCSWFYLK